MYVYVRCCLHYRKSQLPWLISKMWELIEIKFGLAGWMCVIWSSADIDIFVYWFWVPFQATMAPAYPRIGVNFSLSPAKEILAPVCMPVEPELPRPEEEIAFGPACWLWDYLRRSKQVEWDKELFKNYGIRKLTESMFGSSCRFGILRRHQSYLNPVWLCGLVAWFLFRWAYMTPLLIKCMGSSASLPSPYQPTN